MAAEHMVVLASKLCIRMSSVVPRMSVKVKAGAECATYLS